jgi:hypothetical protein
MAVKIKIQKDYFVTEVSVELPAHVAEWDEALRLMQANGKMVVVYNQGSVQGINIEQRLKVPETQAPEIRGLLKIGATVL